jgi:hypothetical protein
MRRGTPICRIYERFAKAVTPNRLVPIHSFATHRFSEFFENVELRQDGEWWSVLVVAHARQKGILRAPYSVEMELRQALFDASAIEPERPDSPACVLGAWPGCQSGSCHRLLDLTKYLTT